MPAGVLSDECDFHDLWRRVDRTRIFWWFLYLAGRRLRALRIDRRGHFDFDEARVCTAKLGRKSDRKSRQLLFHYRAIYPNKCLMKQPGLPALTGLAHGASDAVAGFLIMQVLMLNALPAIDYILLYNALAFGLQPAAALVLDTYKVPRTAVIAGLFLSALSLILTWFSLTWGILAAGCCRVGFGHLPCRGRVHCADQHSRPRGRTRSFYRVRRDGLGDRFPIGFLFFNHHHFRVHSYTDDPRVNHMVFPRRK